MSEFEKVAEPLARYLAGLPIEHEAHKNIVADLYDLVNALRDTWIERAKRLVAQYKAEPDFWNNTEKRSIVSGLLGTIRRLQGVQDVAGD